jgi:hypothetical protein
LCNCLPSGWDFNCVATQLSLLSTFLWFWHLNFHLALPQQAHIRSVVHFQITLHKCRVNAGIMECSNVFPSIPIFSCFRSSFLLSDHKCPVLIYIYDNKCEYVILQMGGMAQMLDHVPSKFESLTLNPNIPKGEKGFSASLLNFFQYSFFWGLYF